MKKIAQVKTERTVYSYSLLFNASWNSLELAKESEEGRFYNCMGSMLFSAFCLEAFFNHIGNTVLVYWSLLERKLSPREKIEVLSSKIGFHPDFGHRPFQTFNEIVAFRNKVVHLKTEHLFYESEQEFEFGKVPELPLADWERLVTLDIAERFLIDTRKMEAYIYQKAGFQRDPFWTIGTSKWEIKPKKFEE